MTLAVRGATIAAGLISIPLTAQYLGTERFGMWLTLSTFLTWVSVADLGLSNSLMNALATADGRQDPKYAKQAVSSAFWLMIGVAGIVTTIFLSTYSFIPWERVFNVSSAQAKADAGPAVLVGMAFFVLRLPLSIPGRIYGAYQEGYFYQLWSGLSSLLSIGGLIAAINVQASLPLLVAAFFGTLLLGDIFSAIHLFGWQRKWLRPGPHQFSWSVSKWLLNVGWQFWLAQISAIIIFQTDLIIVAQLFGARVVASYGVTLKLFTFIGIIQLAFLAPLWAAYSEALSKNDINWIAQIFKKSIYLSFLWSLVVGILLYILSPYVIRSWVGQDAVPEQSLLLAMFFTSTLSAVSQCVGMLINGLCEVRLQTIVGPISAISNLFLSITLGHLLGVSGVAWATAICILIFSLGILGVDVLKKLKKLKMINMLS